MRRRIAYAIYAMGLFFILATVISGFANVGEGGPNWNAAVWNLVLATAIWWITAGVSIRLGVFPVEFFSTLCRKLGLGYDAPIDHASNAPPRPTERRD